MYYILIEFKDSDHWMIIRWLNKVLVDEKSGKFGLNPILFVTVVIHGENYNQKEYYFWKHWNCFFLFLLPDRFLRFYLFYSYLRGVYYSNHSEHIPSILLLENHWKTIKTYLFTAWIRTKRKLLFYRYQFFKWLQICYLY